jgi:hypothetical protein
MKVNLRRNQTFIKKNNKNTIKIKNIKIYKIKKKKTEKKKKGGVKRRDQDPLHFKGNGEEPVSVFLRVL